MSKHFLVLLDGSALADSVLLHTIAFARVFEAQVTLLCMLEYPQPATLVDAFNWQLRKAKAEDYLGSLAVHLQAAGVSARIIKIAGESVNNVLIRVLCQPQIARHASCLLQARASADQVLTRKYEKDVMARLHELAEAEGVDLGVLSVHWYSAVSQQADSHVIANFTAYGTTPFLVVQLRSGDWTPH